MVIYYSGDNREAAALKIGEKGECVKKISKMAEMTVFPFNQAHLFVH